MEFEFLATGYATSRTYPFDLVPGSGGEPDRLDWRPMVAELERDIANGVDVRESAAAFHATVVEMIVAVARRSTMQRVTLSGGCFQNKILVESAIRRLSDEGVAVFWHQRIPPNDGGIALGQAVLGDQRISNDQHA